MKQNKMSNKQNCKGSDYGKCNQRRKTKSQFNYIQNLYEITLEDFSQEFLDVCQVDITFQLTDDIKNLIKIDQEINQLKKRVSKIYDTNKDFLDESRDLFYRLGLVHKAIRETMRTEFGIIDCWENEKGRLKYAQC